MRVPSTDPSGPGTEPVGPGPSAAAPPVTGPVALSARRPVVSADRLVAELVPPPRFRGVSFDSYLPDPGQPSQREAVRVLEEFARAAEPRGGRRRWFGRGDRGPAGPAGVYLDGGYGVGKTHLLASLWHAVPGPKAFGTFVELTNLVGALGFRHAVEAFDGHRLLCVDEFELDDPGDTVLVSTLLGRLVDAGVRLAATSNTLPGRLGEGRFATSDFLREIQGLSAHFRSVRIDGEDYRHRGLPEAPVPWDDGAVTAAARRAAAATADGVVSLDDFGDLLGHLASVHPSRYGALLDGVRAVFLRGVGPVPDQATALRLVVLADRLYDRDLPVVASGAAFDAIFGEEMLRGGYRKKYLRAVSRLVSLARDGAALAAAG